MSLQPKPMLLAYMEENELGERLDLLKLLCFLGGKDVPLSILQRANLPCKVWGSNGEIEELAFVDPHLNALLEKKNLFHLMTGFHAYRTFQLEGSAKGSYVLREYPTESSPGVPNHALADYHLQLLLLNRQNTKRYIVAQQDIARSTGNWNLPDEYQTFSVPSQTLSYIQQFTLGRDEWKREAVLLVCHVFPRDRDLEPNYSVLGRSYLATLKHVVGYFHELNAAGIFSRLEELQMAETLLAASVFSDPTWRFKALDMANEILYAPRDARYNKKTSKNMTNTIAYPCKSSGCDLKLSGLANLTTHDGHYEQSSLDKTRTELSPYTQYLRRWEFLRRLKLIRQNHGVTSPKLNSLRHRWPLFPAYPEDRRSNAQYMRHTLLLAQERLERDEFVQALTILELGQKWALTKPQFFTFGSQSNDPNPSTLEKIVLRQRDFAKCRIYHYQGDFLSASLIFTQLISNPARSNACHRSLLSHHASTLIELGSPLEAEEILRQAIFSDQTAGKDLLVKIALAEALLHQKSFVAASDFCHEVGLTLETRLATNTDQNTRHSYLRILTVMARISHLSGDFQTARDLWNATLSTLTLLVRENGWEDEGMTQMVAFYSLADLEFKESGLGAGKGEEYLARAKAIFMKKGRGPFGLTGLGSFWFNALGVSVERSGACRIDAD